MKSFSILEKDNKLLSLEGKECKLCNNGKIEMPKDKTFRFGPYLQCTNNKCKAVLSINGNLKIETDKSCPEPKCLGRTIKHTFSYKENKKYFECMSCGYRFDGNNTGAIIVFK